MQFCIISRASTGGKTAKTNILVGFCIIERGRCMTAMLPPPWRSSLPKICHGGPHKHFVKNRETLSLFQVAKHFLNRINTRPTYFNNFADPLKPESLFYCAVGALRPGKKALPSYHAIFFRGQSLFCQA